MDFAAEFPRIEPVQQTRFREVVTRLLSGHVLTAGTALKPDADWRFAEKYKDLLDAYLRIAGWRLDFDPAMRLCRAVHEEGSQRVRFSKLESLVLCSLRLVYHEQMRELIDTEGCELNTGELRERLIQAGKPAHQVGRRILCDALRRLARHSIVTIDRGFSGEDAERFRINALIEKVLPSDRIAEWTERIRTYATQKQQPDTGDPEATTSEDESTEAELE